MDNRGHLGDCSLARTPGAMYGEAKFTASEAFEEVDDEENWSQSRYDEVMRHFGAHHAPRVLPDKFLGAQMLLMCFIGPWFKKKDDEPRKQIKKGKDGEKDTPPDGDDAGGSSNQPGGASSSKDPGPGPGAGAGAQPHGSKRALSRDNRPPGKKTHSCVAQQPVPSSCSVAMRRCDCKVPLLVMCGASLPISVGATQLVPLGYATGGSMLCSVLWYFMAAHSLIKVPEVMEVVVAGVEEVAVEVVHGSNKIVRCLTGVIIVIGTVAVVMVGVWSLQGLYRLCLLYTSPSPRD